jgi:hypothetical protein
VHEEKDMTSEVLQLLWYAGFTALGFFLRHLGVGPVVPPLLPHAPQPVPPPAPALPADHPLLLNLSSLLEQILKLLQSQTPKS